MGSGTKRRIVDGVPGRSVESVALRRVSATVRTPSGVATQALPQRAWAAEAQPDAVIHAATGPAFPVDGVGCTKTAPVGTSAIAVTAALGGGHRPGKALMRRR